jgi:hypothetical protein
MALLKIKVGGNWVDVPTAGPPGVGVPVGGAEGQVLTKVGATNYSTEWASVPGETADITPDTDWHYVGAAGEPAFSSPWANYNPGAFEQALRFRKFGDGWVYIQGIITGGTAGSTIFTLPVGYRPAGWGAYPVVHGAGAIWGVDVYNNGVVSPSNTPGFSSVWYTVNVCFQAAAAIPVYDKSHLWALAHLHSAYGWAGTPDNGTPPSYNRRHDGLVRARGQVTGTGAYVGILPLHWFRHRWQKLWSCINYDGSTMVGSRFDASIGAASGNLTNSGNGNRVSLNGLRWWDAVPDTSWSRVTPINGWTHYDTTMTAHWGPGSYYKDQYGWVWLQGLIKSGTTTNGTPMFNLPTGFRPGKRLIFPTNTGAGFQAHIDVRPNGDSCILLGSGHLSLENVFFYAEA